MDYTAIDKLLAKMTPSDARQALKALAAGQSPDSPFARLNTPEFRSALAANRIVASAALRPGFIEGPQQNRVVATAEQIIAAGKKRRGEI